MVSLPTQEGGCCSCTSQVLVCRCSRAQLIPPQVLDGLNEALSELDVDVVDVDDLCGLAASRDLRLASLCTSRPLHVVACYPRAVRWLLHAAGIQIEDRELVVYNLRNRQAEDVVAELSSSVCTREDVVVSRFENSDGWEPWFPVIDYERCDSCGQCASFCIFGTFRTLEGGAVEVASPSSCKTNCPACARVCPRGAIIFPKIAESPINGDEITDENLLQANVQVNIAKLLGDDPRAALAARRLKAKQRLLRRDALEAAEAERCAFSQPTERPDAQPDLAPVKLPCCGGPANAEDGERP